MIKYEFKIFWINLISLIFFVLDRLLKKYFLFHPDAEWQGFAHFLPNSGFVFGWQPPVFMQSFIYLFIGVAFFFLIILLSQGYRQKNTLTILAATLILAGALSNLTDRVLYHFIIDFIDVGIFNVFNLSDLLITNGVLLLIYQLLKNKTLDKKDR